MKFKKLLLKEIFKLFKQNTKKKNNNFYKQKNRKTL